MLRKFLFVSLAVITLASCKKDKDEAPAYHVSAKIDGVKKDFNTAVVAQKDGDAQTGFNVLITGVSGTSIFPMLNLEIYDENAAITTKTYTAASNFGAYCAYSIDSQTGHESDLDFSITVSSVTATDIKGTFSGKVEDGSGGIKTITEGSFSAKFQ
ncbi:MAG TPA: hypothetical protein VJU78_12715 [Chitinophagaceae bacterium]|nr:hypothetical protein [Chitinophagaceae bacterium]